ncbi:hypothetical protein GCM10010992_27770 [Cloacibacterium rupense]|uniref:RteC protein n=1 Tax=Cloacibacterium rupense TaxID=517423 RepID=A0ABQ2NLX0_9FLAO|nr:RteC domain-containing protein [Cloacibacterium rupense]GGP06729.1 hypothetical protein GCM10010992_27770 [Cloacibacterium rupense]
METKLLLKKIDKLTNELEVQLSKFEETIIERTILCEHALIEIDDCIRKVKEMIVSHQFNEMALEIYFFKKLKPHLISKFIYYSKILDIESNKPKAGLKAEKKYYESTLGLLKKFHQQNADFYNYYRRNATYLDHQYFVRYRQDLKGRYHILLHNFDEHFTTLKDDLVAQIIANDLFEKYLLNAIYSIGDNIVLENKNKSNLQWTSTKVNLVELIYALHHTNCFNGGNIELSEVIRHAEKSLQINLSGFHKTIGEIKIRKKERARFLQLLLDNLNQIFLDTDE